MHHGDNNFEEEEEDNHNHRFAFDKFDARDGLMTTSIANSDEEGGDYAAANMLSNKRGGGRGAPPRVKEAIEDDDDFAIGILNANRKVKDTNKPQHQLLTGRINSKPNFLNDNDLSGIEDSYPDNRRTKF